jgi:hypothetical protein
MGAPGCRLFARDRDARWHPGDHLDDRKNRTHELCGRVHIAAVLGLAVGRLGVAAQRPHHCHCKARVAARGAIARDGRIAGGLNRPDCL